jgi:nucleoside-diphosphate-sugar epimerase
MTMRVAITAPETLVGQALSRTLAGAHEVVAIDAELRDPEAVGRALSGAEAVVHLAPLAPLARPAGHAAPHGAAGTWQADREALDRAARGTYVLLKACVELGIRRVVLGSTLTLLERYPMHWTVDESWRPLPDVTDVRQLAAYLAEASARELARVEPLEVVCLRLGTVVDEAAVAGQRYDPRWLHVEDAVQACEAALTVPLGRPGEHSSGRLGYGWWLFHIPGGGRYTRVPLAAARGAPGEQGGLGYAPRHDFGAVAGAGEAPPLPPAPEAAARAALRPAPSIPTRPIRNVVVFGAGGPLAAAGAPLLAPLYRLRLTDLRPLAEIVAEGKPQSPGAPLPVLLDAPHEVMQVDVGDFDQVLRACEGMDAVLNCTVVRPHPVQAFVVNLIGAYHVMRAAVACGIRRVVHTGPLQVLNDRQGGYAWDFGIPDDAPPRPGAWLYLHTKYLGQEVVRLFAEQYHLEVPALLFCNFANPQTARRAGPFTVSWEDAGHALRRALDVPSLPSPCEVLHILADLPHGKYSGAKAYRLLGWYPRDDLSGLWTRRWS